MEDYEVYHVDPFDPDPPAVEKMRPPITVQAIEAALREKHLSYDKLVHELATAMYVIKQRDFQESMKR